MALRSLTAASLIALMAAPAMAFQLDPRYVDNDGDLIADIPEDPSEWVDPDTLVFAYTPVEDPAVYEDVWAEFLDHMSEVTGKPVQFFPVQAEAIRATGASWFQLINYAVQPQVIPRLLGLSLYRLDINFRESAVIGVVGAGGIGAALNTSLSRYENDSAGAILLIIIAIVMLAEYSSSHLRRWVK